MALARRRAQADPAAYAARRVQALEQREPCAVCGRPWSRRTHQIDHILSLPIGRLLGRTDLDAPENLQVLCKQCHRAKTARDNTELARLRRERARYDLAESGDNLGDAPATGRLP